MEVLPTGSDVPLARPVAPPICSKLVVLKDFAYEGPGLGCPKRELDAGAV